MIHFSNIIIVGLLYSYCLSDPYMLRVTYIHIRIIRAGLETDREIKVLCP